MEAQTFECQTSDHRRSSRMQIFLFKFHSKSLLHYRTGPIDEEKFATDVQYNFASKDYLEC